MMFGYLRISKPPVLTLQEPLRQIPSSQVATLVGAQYYWLRHYHPISLLGHMMVMEGCPSTGRVREPAT